MRLSSLLLVYLQVYFQVEEQASLHAHLHSTYADSCLFLLCLPAVLHPIPSLPLPSRTNPKPTTNSYCAPALASSAYALALLRFRPPRSWVQTLLFQTQRQMPAFGAQELSNLLWALAVLGVRPGAAWLREFEQQVGLFLYRGLSMRDYVLCLVVS